MAGRLAAVLTSILASLGLAGIIDDGNGDDPKPPADVQQVDIIGSDDEKRVEVRIVQAEGADDDPAVALREAYDAIRRLKAERLEERPRELLDRAADLYRQAILAYGKEGEDAQREARGMAIAARELARAVERLRDAQRTGRTDPDLPPPPAPKFAARTYRAVPVPPAAPLPPPLPPGVGPVPPAPPAPPLPPAPPAVPLGPDGKVESKNFVFVRPGPDGKVQIPEQLRGRVFVTPKGDVLKGAEGLPKIQRYEFRVDGKEIGERVRRQVEEARRQAEAARGQAAKAQEEARKQLEEVYRKGMGADQAKAFETARGLAEMYARGMKGDPAARAREDLQRAYDKIAAARKAAGDDAKGRYYLDAARDLYNAARRDAEAGRHERASELARAAEALTLVPQNLPEAGGGSPRAHIERRVRVAPGPGGEVKVAPDEDRKPEARETDEPEAKADAGDDAETEIEGIGAALTVEDGKVVVMELVPGGPAAKDGRLRTGDVLVGVLKEGDEKVTFEGKELKEIVESLRGKAGSSVKILVKPKEKDETVTYELKRAKVPVPPRPEAKDEAARDLPPALPED